MGSCANVRYLHGLGYVWTDGIRFRGGSVASGTSRSHPSGVKSMPWTCFIVAKRSEAKESGAMWSEHNTKGNKMDWFVRLPNGSVHNIHSKSSDGTPWEVTGEAPNFTVTPSINCLEIRNKDGNVWHPGYHGWLQNGVLSDDCEGRIY
jgi:hypothetical protein